MTSVIQYYNDLKAWQKQPRIQDRVKNEGLGDTNQFLENRIMATFNEAWFMGFEAGKAHAIERLSSVIKDEK